MSDGNDDGGRGFDPQCEFKRLNIVWMVGQVPPNRHKGWTPQQRADWMSIKYLGVPLAKLTCEQVDRAWGVVKEYLEFVQSTGERPPLPHPLPTPEMDCETMRALIETWADWTWVGPADNPMDHIDRAARHLFGHSWKEVTCEEVERLYHPSKEVFEFFRILGE